ncbi:MAG: hypothetical protein CVT49_01830 [candidate division Zixibacteria bacterium HGW-Zixibacteria-1]|nr:MAG: hypothetical protein CVT49_01830 [candidate division Zixibacteria bacterium HGW-Zixibacteria-1]
MTNSFRPKFAVLIFLTLLLSGCNLASRRTAGPSVIESEFRYDQGQGDAFLYDVKIYREGKKNSVRLDVYRTGDRLAIFARGYLGKGVLKGLVLPDSIIIYFPTENEFYSGKLNELISKSCSEKNNLERMLIDLFVKRPVEIDYSMTDFYVSILSDKGKKQQFRLESTSCAESAELQYDFLESRFILEKIDFSNRDESFRFKAERRKQRLNVNIPAEKLDLSIPDDAVRINL